MSVKRMLIDATYPEETRVAVVSGNRLDDFDVEVASRKQLKSNVYLAKVMRVEPSLQAAFVDYGGNRHGFLAFNEIHPDYYQIPVADREALVAEQTAQDAEERASLREGEEGQPPAGAVETVGGDDGDEIEVRRPRPSARRYKIQEVIKKRQILLVQVVKEERGTKGAALTTYISLPGRYCVLMPNTGRGGGISRKIGSSADRNRLKSILGELGIPDGMAVIVRTAGSKRNKSEIKRDYDYLLRLWNTIRETTLESIAPCLIHEEGDLVLRAIRDIYTKDIEEVIVAGEEGYRKAKEFMKLLIPSHARRVKAHESDGVPLFRRYQFEDQLDSMHGPIVQLKSGGYIVINPTEALVSIDVNSGRATRERNIEETALATNLEAADEIARQLRLRDLAGLIVIDFIDMEIGRNQARVERQLKEALRTDRARIQVGRISPFGLLEMSRQRLRPSLIETSTEPCPHCAGSGIRRSTDSSALIALRAIEEEALRQRPGNITVHVPIQVALFVLNRKRAALTDIENRFSIRVSIEGDDSLIPPAFRIERTDGAGRQPVAAARPPAAEPAQAAGPPSQEREGGRRRPRERGHRVPPREETMPPGEEAEQEPREEEAPVAVEAKGPPPAEAAAPVETAEGAAEVPRGKRRRRGRRGGRRRGRRPHGHPGEPTPAGYGEADVRVMSPGPDFGGAPEPTSGEPTAYGAPPEPPPAARPDERPWREAAPEPSVPGSERERVPAESHEVAPAGPPVPERPPITPEPAPVAEKIAARDAERAEHARAAEAPPSAEAPAEVSPEERAALAKTKVIRVGAEAEPATPAPKRRGWWRRAGE